MYTNFKVILRLKKINKKFSDPIRSLYPVSLTHSSTRLCFTGININKMQSYQNKLINKNFEKFASSSIPSRQIAPSPRGFNPRFTKVHWLFLHLTFSSSSFGFCYIYFILYYITPFYQHQNKSKHLITDIIFFNIIF